MKYKIEIDNRDLELLRISTQQMQMGTLNPSDEVIFDIIRQVILKADQRAHKDRVLKLFIEQMGDSDE